MSNFQQKPWLEFAKTFALRLALGRFLLTLLGAGLSLFIVAFAGALEVKLQGVLFGTSFSINYGSATSAAWPLVAGVCIVGLAVWIFFTSQSEPKSKKISTLEDAYKAKGNSESVRQRFRETFGVAVRSGPELDFVLKSQDVQSIANSLRRARSHVEFSSGGRYSLNRPKWPYRALRLVFSWLYFAMYFLAALTFPAALASIIQHDHQLTKVFAGCFIVFSVVAWACLSAYSATFHAIRLTKSDA